MLNFPHCVTHQWRRNRGGWGDFSPPKILDFVSKKYKLAPQNFQKSMFSPPTSEYLPAPLMQRLEGETILN